MALPDGLEGFWSRYEGGGCWRDDGGGGCCWPEPPKGLRIAGMLSRLNMVQFGAGSLFVICGSSRQQDKLLEGRGQVVVKRCNVGGLVLIDEKVPKERHPGNHSCLCPARQKSCLSFYTINSSILLHKAAICSFHALFESIQQYRPCFCSTNNQHLLAQSLVTSRCQKSSSSIKQLTPCRVYSVTSCSKS